MNLIIDIGNSFVKMAVFQENELLVKNVVEKENFQIKLRDFFLDYPKIEKTILSSVSGNSFPWAESLKNTAEVLVLGPQTGLPFRNLYLSPETLGNDRKALVAAACRKFPQKNVLVIDAGTCLTFDFKNQKEEYLGGAISPGLQMRYKALHAFTANLPELTPVEDVHLIGDHTKNCIHSGVINGMLKEIEGVMAGYNAEYEDLEIIFTGGDAHFLSKSLKNSIFATSSFLLEGLNYILEFNRTQ